MSPARLSQLPAVPALKESGLNVPFMPGWYALIGPANMEAAAVQKLGASLQKMFTDPEVKARLDGLSMVVVGGTAAAMRERALSESKIWGDLIAKQKIAIE